ncbi:MAG: IPT/TIG domain-containing protein [Solirubrobacteraceae bacterium]
MSFAGAAIAPALCVLTLAGCGGGAPVPEAPSNASVPTVTAIAPNNGPVAGGTKVTITGAGFTAGSTVRFGARPASAVDFRASTSITVKSPAGSGTVDVVLRNANGSAPTTPRDQFAYDPPPATPWLGLNGNSSSSLGPIDSFAKHRIVYDRSGPIEWEAGALPEQEGRLTTRGGALRTDFEAGMIPVVTIEYRGYDGSFESSPSFPTERNGSHSLREYVAGFVASASAILRAFPGRTVLFEPINEPWGYTTPQFDGAEYADVIAKLLPAARAAGIPLQSIYVAATGRGWVPAMYAAQPRLETEIAGWYLHPYGSPSGTEGQDVGGIQALPAIQSLMSSGQNNIVVSEVGYCALDARGRGGCAGSTMAPTGAGAAAKLTKMLDNALPYHEAGWLRALIVYSRDDGGWAMETPGGKLTDQGRALVAFAAAHG